MTRINKNKIDFEETGEPSEPFDGEVTVYVKNDKEIYKKGDDGEEVRLSIRDYQDLDNRVHGNEDHETDYQDSEDLNSAISSHKEEDVHTQPQEPEQHGNEKHDDDYIEESQKASAEGVAELGEDAKLLEGQIPSLAITDVFVVDNEDELTTLDARQGDVGLVNDDTEDEYESYILTTDDPSNLDNWETIRTPKAPIQSVFNRTGDIIAKEGDYDYSLITGTHGNEDHSEEFLVEDDVSDFRFSSYQPGMVNWQNELDYTEVQRVELPEGRRIVVDRVEFRQKGGGASTNDARLRVRDVSEDVVVHEEDLNSASSDVGESASGSVVVFEVYNFSGDVIDAAPTIDYRIVE